MLTTAIMRNHAHVHAKGDTVLVKQPRWNKLTAACNPKPYRITRKNILNEVLKVNVINDAPARLPTMYHLSYLAELFSNYFSETIMKIRNELYSETFLRYLPKEIISLMLPYPPSNNYPSQTVAQFGSLW